MYYRLQNINFNFIIFYLLGNPSTTIFYNTYNIVGIIYNKFIVLERDFETCFNLIDLAVM